MKVEKLKDGTLVIGRKVFVICGDCGKYVHMNKFLFGSYHFCTSEGNSQTCRVGGKISPLQSGGE